MTAELDGYRVIELFILAEGASPSLSLGEQVSETWQKEQGVDASASIYLLTPSFSLAAPSSIAEGDDVVLTGSASGTDQVYLIVIDDRGDTVFPPVGTDPENATGTVRCAMCTRSGRRHPASEVQLTVITPSLGRFYPV
jgi:hypothetical protein